MSDLRRYLARAARPGETIDLGGRTLYARRTVQVGAGTAVQNGRVVAVGGVSPVFSIASAGARVSRVTVEADGLAGVVGVSVGPGARGVVLDGVHFADCFRGVEVLGASGDIVLDAVLDRCRYSHAAPTSSTSQHAVYAAHVTGLVISDLLSEDTHSDAVALRAQCARTHVLRGRLYRPGRSSASNGNGIDGNSGLVDSVIDGVYVEGAHGSGIVVEDGPFAAGNGSHCRNVEIRGAHVRGGVAPSGGKAHGIEVVLKSGGDRLPHDVRVIGGVSEECEGSGVFVLGRLVTVVGHTARRNREYGFTAANGALDVSFVGCVAAGNGTEGDAAWAGLHANGALRVAVVGCRGVGRDGEVVADDAALALLDRTQDYAARFQGTASGWHGPTVYGHSDSARPVRVDAAAMTGVLYDTRDAPLEDGPGSLFLETDAGVLHVRGSSAWGAASTS